MRKDKASSTATKNSAGIKEVFFGVLAGALICMAFLFLFAFSFVKMGAISLKMLSIMVIISASLGAFVAGFVCVKIYREKGLLYGSLSGVVLFFLITIIAFIISREAFTYFSLIKLAFMVICGALGGVIAVNGRRR